MDSNFSIKPPAGARRGYALRDPVPVREAVETDLATSKTVAAMTGDGKKEHQHEPHPDHSPHDVVLDPESRDVILHENDVRAQDAARDHPDHALLRQRAYRPARIDAEAKPDNEPHANIKA